MYPKAADHHLYPKPIDHRHQSWLTSGITISLPIPQTIPSAWLSTEVQVMLTTPDLLVCMIVRIRVIGHLPSSLFPVSPAVVAPCSMRWRI